MGVLNVRIDDDILDELQRLADADGVTRSDFVRDLVRAAVIPVAESPGSAQMAPETFALRDRLILSLLHRILARVLPPEGGDVDGDEEYQLMRAKILESGFAGQYWLEVAGFATELSPANSRQVLDILDMHRAITFSVRQLADAGTPIDDGLAYAVEFHGFDHNDPLEGQMADYVEFLMADGDRWEELAPQIEANDRGNSHFPMLDTYRGMLAEYRRIMAGRVRRFDRGSRLLNAEELDRLRNARVHPSRRAR